MGWEKVEIGDVCNVIPGQSPKSKFYNNDGNGLPFYQGKKDFGQSSILPPRFWTTEITKEAKKGDILMSVRAPVGPVNFATEHCCIGRGLAAIRASNRIDVQFLFYYFLNIQNELVGSDGAVFNSINSKQIRELSIPLPSLPEQRRLVCLLDTAFAEIERARVLLARNLVNAGELFEALIDSLIDVDSHKWQRKKLGDSAFKIGTGPFGTMLHKSDYISGGTPIVNPIHMSANRIVPSDSKTISPAKVEELGSYVLHENDIVMARRGEIGRCALVTSKESGYICGTGSFYIRPGKHLNSEFLISLLTSRKFVQKLEDVSTGATMKNISNKSLSNLEIYVPTLEEQLEFVLKLEGVVEQTQTLQTHYTHQLNHLTELKQSLLAKAFAGEL